MRGPGERSFGGVLDARIVEEDRRLAVIKNVRRLAVGKAEVDGAVDGAELLGGELQKGELGAVHELVCHDSVLADSVGGKGVGETVAFPVGVDIGPLPVPQRAREGGPVPVAARVAQEAIQLGEFAPIRNSQPTRRQERHG